MAKSNSSAAVPLTRWRYFTKNLYNNSGNSASFAYEKVIYNKSEELQEIETRTNKINVLLLLALVVMFFVTSKVQNILIVLAYMVLVVAGQVVRFCMLPKNIGEHLTDSGYRER